MNIFETLDIKISNAVLVTESGVADEVEGFLEQYGRINRSLVVDSPESEFHNMLIVEFESGLPLTLLNPLLPYMQTSETGTIYYIKNLSQVYTANVGSSKTQTYLADLKEVAKLTGQNYAEVLNEMMGQISKSISELHPDVEVSVGVKAEQSLGNKITQSSYKMAAPSSLLATAPIAQPGERGATINFTASDLNPPELQRYVVEHIVKSEDTAVHLRSSHRLRVFSGKVPRPQHEVDYDTWRSSVDLVLSDPAISEIQRSRQILDSLLPPAADMVKHLSPDMSVNIYIQQLDSAYGTVQDGEELYAKFMDTLQNAGEKPSAYLQRLQVVLNLAVKRGGAPKAEVNKHLLNQFCRGCWDNVLISELQLKQKKEKPPSFAELLLLLRTEEDREAVKAQRMKQHLGGGGARQKVTSQAQIAYGEEEKNLCETLTIITKQLTEQMAAIQRQLAVLTVNQSQGRQSYTPRPNPVLKSRGKPNMAAAVSDPSASPKPGFCFRCGEDGHIRPQCDNQPNPELVSAKKRQFSEKKSKWQKRNQPVLNHLN